MSGVLEFDSVSVRRGQSFLLDDISLTIAEGEHWAVLGPNGAGKTTLLQLAGARMHPTTGAVHILEEKLGRVDVFELRPRIGFASSNLMQQTPRSELVRDFVLTAAYGVLGRWTEEYEPDDVARAEDLLAAFRIGELADREFGTLSEGERKRAQIARALMTDPELLLLDEPASGLDLGGREELLQALTEIVGSKHAPTTLMVTHHVEEIPLGITHAVMVREGGLVAAGPLAEVLTEDNLESTFGLPVILTEQDGRYAARARL
ncbi:MULTISPECIES: ABC transporter ATP-binding protein [Brevibacterium]|jgi:iron complex transport system ATP-binding protein|uniref:ABC transporter ATP-binding protein n=1 Tax=Brevibacterium salitolerans TaxID=1403566 RepID=A0ABP5I4C6_9MICO|nr:ABC transporter ATP-binding protein [Brevibacterium sp.]